MRSLLVLLASVLGLLLGFAVPAEAAAEPSGAELPVDHVNALAYAVAHRNQPPSGANDWNCLPTAEHPNPVVLAHGSIENMAQNWYALAPLLRNEGYCVYAPLRSRTRRRASVSPVLIRPAAPDGSRSRPRSCPRSWTGCVRPPVRSRSTSSSIPRAG